MVQEVPYLEVTKLVDQIIQGFPAKEIFLFGSYAVGNPRDESDIDLCIITGQEGRKIDLLKASKKGYCSCGYETR